MEKNKKEKIVKTDAVEVKKEVVKDANSKKGCNKLLFVFIFLVIALGFIYFIFFNKKVTVCSSTLDQNESSGYVIKSEYKIKSLRGTAKSAVISNVITSENNTILAYFEKQYKDTYTEQNKKYGGYTVKTETNGKTVTITATIDYTKVNLKELVKDYSGITNDINNNKLSLDGAKKMFTNVGATCEK